MGGRAFQQDEIERIQALARLKVSAAEIGRIVNRSGSSVSRLLLDKGNGAAVENTSRTTQLETAMATIQALCEMEFMSPEQKVRATLEQVAKVRR